MSGESTFSTAGASVGNPPGVDQLLLAPTPLTQLGGLPTMPPRPRVDVPREMQDELIQSRLGVAASLFAALRCKHAETACHSIRVALYCSAWARQLKLDEADRVAIEIAALLHDIGKIGLPEQILTKPGRLSPEERAIVYRHRLMGVEILSTSCAGYKVLEIVSNAPSWYDGSRLKLEHEGERLPLGARMIAIADAYDSMTTPQVYRAAYAHDRAMQELYDHAGSQFDPRLVTNFSAIPTFDQQKFFTGTAANWLEKLGPKTIDSLWQLQIHKQQNAESNASFLYQQRLLDNMYDAVIFLDVNLTVSFWNRGTERLTGINAAGIFQRLYTPELIQLRDERGIPVTAADCPIISALKTRAQSMRRMMIRGRNGKDCSVNLHTIPVIDQEAVLLGAAVLLHDATGEVSLEEQCQDWQTRATLDNLTKLANRAEFDRNLQAMFADHRERQAPCSLIICDIDRFKSVNDTYGHQVGDEVLVSFGQVLRNETPPGCLAARYGGEEFVILCGDTPLAEAAALAERVRLAISQIPQSGMGGKCVTSSFGVTELQGGDSPEIMLRRADRGLYMAKEGGRNRVIQLGAGMTPDQLPERRKTGFWARLFGGGQKQSGHTRSLITTAALDLTIEKLRGFISDYSADLLAIDEQHVRIELDSGSHLQRRRADRPERLVLDFNFSVIQQKQLDSRGIERGVSCTKIDVIVTPKSKRNRRQEALDDAVKQMLVSVRSYLMASDYEAPLEKNDNLRTTTPADTINESKSLRERVLMSQKYLSGNQHQSED